MNYAQMTREARVVLVEFFATWCPHCQKMMPVVAEVRERLGKDIPVVQLDIDQNKAVAQEARVDGVPTFIIYLNGTEVWRYSGEIDGDELLARIRSY